MAKKKAADAGPAHVDKQKHPSAYELEQAQKKSAKQAAAEVSETKPAIGGKKRPKDEIDEIFGSKKKKEVQSKDLQAGDVQLNQNLQDIARQVAQEKAKSKKPKVEGSKDDIFGEQIGKARKRTEEGYAVYGEDELGLNKRGGDTPLCPFDCDCCF